LLDTGCGLIWIDDPSPAWIRFFNLDKSKIVRQFSSLHLDMQFEQLLFDEDGEFCGYASIAKLHKSKWARGGRSVPLNIEYNGTIRARETW
jgi:hypothetical protein